MNRGSILIARKITGSSIWIRHPLYLKVWVWILERASHKDHQRNGHQYKRGEFVTTYDEMTRAAAYYHNRKYILPTAKQIRVILAWFQKEEMITFEPIKGTGANPLNSGLGLTVADPRAQTGAYIGIRIIVINYDTYQNMQSYKGRHQGRPSSEQGHDNKYGTNMVKNPPDFFLEISLLEDRYQNPELIDRVFQAISSTRKSGKIADSVKLGILKAWERCPVESVLSGIQTYLSKGYPEEGKGEKYLLGIIRNSKTEPPKPTGPTIKRSGSPLLDNYYKEQGVKLI